MNNLFGISKPVYEYCHLDKPLDPDKQHVKIFGLPRSGTNFVTLTLQSNFTNVNVLVNVGGWKHGYYCVPWILREETHVLIVVRDPYAWCFSMHRFLSSHRVWGEVTSRDINEFVQSKASFGYEPHAPFLYKFRNWVEMWNELNGHWTSLYLNDRKLGLAPWEDFLTQPDSLLCDFGRHFGLQRTGCLTIPEHEVSPSGENPELSEKLFNKSFFLKKEYLNSYSNSTLRFINDNLDIRLMESFGYKVEE